MERASRCAKQWNLAKSSYTSGYIIHHILHLPDASSRSGAAGGVGHGHDTGGFLSCAQNGLTLLRSSSGNSRIQFRDTLLLDHAHHGAHNQRQLRGGVQHQERRLLRLQGFLVQALGSMLSLQSIRAALLPRGAKAILRPSVKLLGVRVLHGREVEPHHLAGEEVIFEQKITNVRVQERAAAGALRLGGDLALGVGGAGAGDKDSIVVDLCHCRGAFKCTGQPLAARYPLDQLRVGVHCGSPLQQRRCRGRWGRCRGGGGGTTGRGVGRVSSGKHSGCLLERSQRCVHHQLLIANGAGQCGHLHCHRLESLSRRDCHGRRLRGKRRRLLHSRLAHLDDLLVGGRAASWGLSTRPVPDPDINLLGVRLVHRRRRRPCQSAGPQIVRPRKLRPVVEIQLATAGAVCGVDNLPLRVGNGAPLGNVNLGREHSDPLGP
mmetsp:Transcript_49235/g.111715  ORF Transcript_49235/g.111715 Transcript_49235/m.111715 type:complete len:434 (-) Transcript_49235:224-1525(-)